MATVTVAETTVLCRGADVPACLRDPGMGGNYIMSALLPTPLQGEEVVSGGAIIAHVALLWQPCVRVYSVACVCVCYILIDVLAIRPAPKGGCLESIVERVVCTYMIGSRGLKAIWLTNVVDE